MKNKRDKHKLNKIVLFIMIAIIIIAVLFNMFITYNRITSVEGINISSSEDVSMVSEDDVATVAVEPSYTGITSVGASTIVITDINWREPDTITTTGSINYAVYSNRIILYWDTTSMEAGEILTGTYTLTYSNIGYDADGDSIDLTIYSSASVENVLDSTNSWGSDTVKGVAVLNINTYCLDSNTYNLTDNKGITEGTEMIHNLGVLQNLTVSFTKSETNTSATGDYVFYVCDIDVVRTAYPEYTESVTLISGFSSTVYLEEDTKVAVDGTKYYATETDESTEFSSLTTLSSANFEFSWTGMGAGTEILIGFNTSTITSNIYTSVDGGSLYSLDYTGGSITANNTSGYSVLSQTSSATSSITTYWKNSYNYSTSANEGYHLAKISTDGTESSTATTATFSSVVSAHTFYAYYVANSYSVKFNRKWLDIRKHEYNDRFIL